MSNHILGGELHCGSSMWCNGSDDFGMWRSQQTTSNGVPGTYNHFRAAYYDAVILFSENIFFKSLLVVFSLLRYLDSLKYQAIFDFGALIPEYVTGIVLIFAFSVRYTPLFALVIRIWTVSGLNNHCFFPLLVIFGKSFDLDFFHFPILFSREGTKLSRC